MKKKKTAKPTAGITVHFCHPKEKGKKTG